MLIYLVRNTINNKWYVGQTIGTLDERWKRHVQRSKNTKSTKSHLHAAMVKYGIEHFETITLMDGLSDKQELDKWEKIFISCFESRNPAFGYNLTKGGWGSLGWKHSEESRNKMSLQRIGNQYAKGFKHSEETRAKLSKAYNRNPAFKRGQTGPIGIKWSKERREAFSMYKKQFPSPSSGKFERTPEFREKVRAGVLRFLENKKLQNDSGIFIE